MISILLPAARFSTPEEAQTCWGDLRVALASVAAYASDVEVVVGWNGLEEPTALPENPRMRLLRQAPGITTGSQAWNWCAAQTDADELIILGDDCVLHPDTLRLLLQDVQRVQADRAAGPIGFVGTRSNYVKGPQNIRVPNDGVLDGIGYNSEHLIVPAPMIVPVCAWVRHEVFDLVGGFPDTNWFADDLICWDLAQRGYHHYVSRAYVHHVGQRATAQGKSSRQLLDEGLAWLVANRPDFHAALLAGVS